MFAGRFALVVVSGLFAVAAPSFVVRGDEKVGSFAVKADGGLAGAIRAFGRPRLKGGGEACTATWSSYGLSMGFYNLGGRNACDPRYGRFNKAVMHGTRWRTDRKLRIGMTVAQLQTAYPRATFHRGRRYLWPSGWWLVTRPSQFGLGGTYPGLLAETSNGVVRSLQVRFAAGGD